MSDDKITINDINNVAASAADWWVSKMSGEITNEQMQKFHATLVSEIKTGLALSGYVTLQTDYYPEELLAKVANQTFIKGSEFPQKVLMDISPREVGVRQNHAEREVIFAIQKKTKLSCNHIYNQNQI